MSSETRKYALKARAEKQAETRQRIVEATAALHTEVGPAQTTVAEIARRAGVQRLTVYNNFPDEKELFEACGAYWLAENPPPDPTAALAIRNPAERLRAVLVPRYSWYRYTARTIETMRRDRPVTAGRGPSRVRTRHAGAGNCVIEPRETWHCVMHGTRRIGIPAGFEPAMDSLSLTGILR